MADKKIKFELNLLIREGRDKDETELGMQVEGSGNDLSFAVFSNCLSHFKRMKETGEDPEGEVVVDIFQTIAEGYIGGLIAFKESNDYKSDAMEEIDKLIEKFVSLHTDTYKK